MDFSFIDHIFHSYQDGRSHISSSLSGILEKTRHSWSGIALLISLLFFRIPSALVIALYSSHDKGPFLPVVEEVKKIGDELEKLSKVEEVKALENSLPKRDSLNGFFFWLCLWLVLWLVLPWVELMYGFVIETVIFVVGYIDRGGSKAGSSGSLDFRDIYISIVLFQAAYVWIKFRDVIPRGAVYKRPGSNKWEPRIKFPVMKGVGVMSKRIPLGLYDTLAEGEVAYQIAAFYCNKPQNRLGRLDLGGGAYFPIPALSVDANLPYKEQVNQVQDLILKVYGEFEEQKASRNFLPTSVIQQRRQPLNSRMDLAMQGEGSQLVPNIHTEVNFNNPSSAVLAKTQHELLEAYKQIDCLKTRVSQTEVENMGWEVKYSELEQRNLQLERENGLLNHQNMQLLLQTQHQEQDFDPDRFLNMGHEESLAR